MANIQRLVRSLRCSHRYLSQLTAPIAVNANRVRSLSHESKTNVERDPKPLSGSSQEHDDHQYEEDIKTKILENSLSFVEKHGWSKEALSAGAEASGYPGVAHGLFPNGAGDLIHYFNLRCNDDLVDLMEQWPKEDLRETKVPAKFVEEALCTRLFMIDPYKKTWHIAMAIQSLPSNVPNSLATLLSLVDDICYHSGDRSVDFNWYVRRVGLAGIYKTAELFYLADSSQGHTSTRSFVSSRIRDAQLVQSALNLNPVAAAPATLSAAFVTAKNILGINPLTK